MNLNKNVTEITFVKSHKEMTQLGYNQSNIKFSILYFQQSYVPTLYFLMLCNFLARIYEYTVLSILYCSCSVNNAGNTSIYTVCI